MLFFFDKNGMAEHSTPQLHVPWPFKEGGVTCEWPDEFDVAVVVDFGSVGDGGPKTLRYRLYEAELSEHEEVEDRAIADMQIECPEDDGRQVRSWSYGRDVWTHGGRARRLRCDEVTWLLQAHATRGPSPRTQTPVPEGSSDYHRLDVMAFDSGTGKATTSYAMFQYVDLAAHGPDALSHAARQALATEGVVLYGVRLQEWWD